MPEQENPLYPFVPSDRKETNLPLYAAVGISAKDGEDCYFHVTEILKKGDTVADALIYIADMPRWSSRKKAFAAYQLHKEILKEKTPAHLRWAIDKLGF